MVERFVFKIFLASFITTTIAISLSLFNYSLNKEPLPSKELLLLRLAHVWRIEASFCSCISIYINVCLPPSLPPSLHPSSYDRIASSSSCSNNEQQQQPIQELSMQPLFPKFREAIETQRAPRFHSQQRWLSLQKVREQPSI